MYCTKHARCCSAQNMPDESEKRPVLLITDNLDQSVSRDESDRRE